MKAAKQIRWYTLCTCSALYIATLALAGPPPYPDELKYPNIVPPVAQFGTFGTGLGEFIDPSGIIITDDDRIYIADTGNHRIQVFSLSGKPLFAWSGTHDAPMIAPVGMALHRSSNSVFVTDVGDHTVKQYTLKGEYLKQWGKFGKMDGEFNQPLSLTINDNIVIVADSRNNRIQLFNTDGSHLRTVGRYGKEPGEFNHPLGVATDGKDFMFVADSENNRVQKFSLSGDFVKTWGQWGSKAGLFATPSSIAHSEGELYLTDLVNHRMQVFDCDGRFLRQWGRHPAVAHEGNGRVHYPGAIALSPTGSFAVVTESFENRAQVFLRDRTSSVRQVDDSAWWDKATRFHYGTSTWLSQHPSDADPCTDCRPMMGISEPDTHSVLLFEIDDVKPRLISRIGGYGRGFGQFIRPTGGTFDPKNGKLYVCDAGNQRIQMFSLLSEGKNEEGLTTYSIKFLKAVGTPNADKSNELTESIPGFPGVLDPSKIRRGKNGEFFVLDAGNARVLTFDSNLQFIRAWGKYGTGDGEFREPLDIAIAKDGETIYVSDVYNFRIQMLDLMGNYKSSWGKNGPGPGEFVTLFGLAPGYDGSLFATDTGKNRVQKFDAQGNFIKEWGKWGSGPGEFYKPKGIAQDSRGRVFVVDFGNHRGQIFDSDGNFIAMFGIGDIDKTTEKNGERQAAAGYNTKTTYRLPSGKPNGKAETQHEKLDGLKVVSNAGTYSVAFKTAAASIPLNKGFDLQLAIARQGEGAGNCGDVKVAFDAVMPSHQHGMNRTPRIVNAGEGQVAVEGIVLHMPGSWEMYVDITEGYHTERVQVNLLVD